MGGRMKIPYIPAQRGTAVPRGDWRAHAACRGKDPLLFFPAGTGGAALEAAARAKRVCGGCPVRVACLDWALATGREIGVLGGTTESERRALRARRSLRSIPRGA